MPGRVVDPLPTGRSPLLPLGPAEMLQAPRYLGLGALILLGEVHVEHVFEDATSFYGQRQQKPWIFGFAVVDGGFEQVYGQE